jgi:glyceraldehyde-3-phosphate dehydrogenase/erythrose-4-phosphate dehydrogenase
LLDAYRLDVVALGVDLVDLVLECTEVFASAEDLEKHVQASAPRRSAPAIAESLGCVGASLEDVVRR